MGQDSGKSVYQWCLVLLLSLPLSAAGDSPDVTLEGLDGRKYHLSEFIGSGKWVILNVWGPRCPPCLDEMPELVSFHEDHVASDAMVVGMALDYPSFGYAKKDEVEVFVDENFVSFPILLGDAGVFRRFGAGALRGVPTSLIYTPPGNLAAVHVGTLTQALIENFIARYDLR